MSAFVELEGVTKRFGDLVVLRSVDLSVGEHQVVCLIGASGSGKSTLLRCVNLLERIEEGPPAQIFSAPKEPRTQEFLARVLAAGRM